jgi:hypothetical protein
MNRIARCHYQKQSASIPRRRNSIWLYLLVVAFTYSRASNAFTSVPRFTAFPVSFTQLRTEHSLPQRTWRQREVTSRDGKDSSQQSHDSHLIEQSKTKPMPIKGYDADAILKFYDNRPWEVGWRLNSLGLPLLGWYFGLVTDRILGIQEQEDVQRRRGAELRGHLVRSKSVALIKVSLDHPFVQTLKRPWLASICDSSSVIKILFPILITQFFFR